MVYLPIELLTEVARRVGHNGFRGLAGFISGGTNGRDAAFDNKVLMEVDLDEFIFVSSLANEGSLYRPFFMKCFTAGNMTAKYVEGLRLLVKFGPSNDRLRLVIEAEPLVYALFALSIFSICSGSYESGMGAMIMLSMRVGWLDELVEIGETVMSQIADIEPPSDE
ncbi:hypothetical protein V5N11_005397 [Cardamine amara subsp. amara]|uniref:Uncharacterized protein n=1 Tax=Cardamine amara subsp. amara TaxID=228776 RepID=A0ABD0ZTI2_CARAN